MARRTRREFLEDSMFATAAAVAANAAPNLFADEENPGRFGEAQARELLQGIADLAEGKVNTRCKVSLICDPAAATDEGWDEYRAELEQWFDERVMDVHPTAIQDRVSIAAPEYDYSQSMGRAGR